MNSISLRLYFTLLLLNCSWAAQAQEQSIDFRKDFQYNISITEEAIKVDGKLDEAVWQDAAIGSDFWQKIPFYKAGAEPKTEVMLTYDDNNLYVATRCWQPNNYVVRSLKRDEYWDNTGIAIILDPLNSKANAMLFGTSVVGVQWDAIRTETSGISSDWSNKWFVETQSTAEYWTAEFAIPFKILRYDPTSTEWGMNFVRNLVSINEFHNWTSVPESFWPPNPAFAGALLWDNPPTKKSGNYNLIPYVTSSASKRDGEDTKTDFNLGLDARVALTASLNLDLTLNPDFSQIEVDELVTNLTRFNIGLPEKRTFFLENADLFADFGNGGSRPFFSRKIGLDQNFNAVPILYGARLTGNITNDIRVGAMNIHSNGTDNSLGQNQTAISVKKQLGRSFVQGMVLNRQSFDASESVSGDYGRNASVEGLYLTEDGKWATWAGLHQSFKPEISGKTGMYNWGANYRSPRWEILTSYLLMQENYFADMGFLARIENYDAVRDTSVRVGYHESLTTIDHYIRPQEGNITRHTFGFENLLIFNEDGSFNERYNRLRYFLSFRNTSEFQVRLNYRDVDLLFPFSFTGSVALPSERYKTYDLNIEYSSDGRKPLSYSISAQTGGFFNGRLTRVNLDANYRVQPWGNFSIGYQWNDLNFPEPYGNAKITALVSKIEIGFSKNLLWTTLFQYVDQSDFMGINSRLQWRFSPMSDIFLVLVDNYDVLNGLGGSSDFRSNNRAVIVKANYWW